MTRHDVKILEKKRYSNRPKVFDRDQVKFKPTFSHEIELSVWTRSSRSLNQPRSNVMFVSAARRNSQSHIWKSEKVEKKSALKTFLKLISLSLAIWTDLKTVTRINLYLGTTPNTV